MDRLGRFTKRELLGVGPSRIGLHRHCQHSNDDLARTKLEFHCLQALSHPSWLLRAGLHSLRWACSFAIWSQKATADSCLKANELRHMLDCAASVACYVAATKWQSGAKKILIHLQQS